MANLVVVPVLFTFVILLSSSPISSSSNDTLPTKYFISCGSRSNVTLGATTFSGDLITDSSVTFSDPSTTIGPTQTRLTGIYQTARVFRQPQLSDNWYKLQIQDPGIYMLRLHFNPQHAQPNATFDVLASGFVLLSNFTVPTNLNNNTTPLIKEFLIPVNTSNLFIYFRPLTFAFINAIEAFITPPDFIPGTSVQHVTSQGINTIGFQGLPSNALTVIHRINVGGSLVVAENDTLRRNWVPDDPYLYSSDAAKKAGPTSVNYEDGGATSIDAPDSVYGTANEMNIDTNRKDNNFNVTWRFRVNNGATFFVRLHFCDIVSDSRNDTVFNLFIYSQFSVPVTPFDGPVSRLAAPFYMDFVVDSDAASGNMSISIGPRYDSVTQNAFLNGVEIMQLIYQRESVPEGNGHKNRVVIIVASAVGAVVVIVVSVAAVLFCLKSRKTKNVDQVEWPLVNVFGGSSHSKTTERTTIGGTTPDMNLGLKIPLAEILYATRNFDPKFLIGEGGFGKVYKGTLRNGDRVAVKRSDQEHGQGLMEFQTEIVVLSKIRHHHLVSLIGYCDERYEMILVYEFMEKGTLREHLYKPNEDLAKSNSQSVLSWDKRLEICIGAAKGLHYLHTGLNEPIIHRDIKSTNILLDECYVAKVADFGLSKSGTPDQTHISTDVKGSFGYLDPEYLRCMQLTLKSDVYSFGVVLLEVLCARPAVNNLLPRDQINLAEWGLRWQRENQIEKIIDPLLTGKINPNSLRKFGETVEKCLQENGVDRPNMVDVLWDLKYALQLQQSTTATDHEESNTTTDVSWKLALPGIHRIPSIDVTTSYTDSEVFSQLRMDDAR